MRKILSVIGALAALFFIGCIAIGIKEAAETWDEEE